MKGMLFKNLVMMSGILLLSSGSFKVYESDRHLFVSNFENVLGTSMEIKVVTSTGDYASQAEKMAMQEIDRLSNILSSYDPQSEFSYWLETQNQNVKVSPELYEVLDLFDQWRAKTSGALDPSAEVASRVWRNSSMSNTLPSEQQLQKAAAEINQSHWILHPENGTVTHITHSPIKLNSFVKSYIINKACDAVLAAIPIDGIIINIGGDLVVKGAITEMVNVTDPMANAENSYPLSRLTIKNKAVATSGNYRRGFQLGEQWYSHIIDPRTAMPVDHVISATVVADNATDAGALATAFNVLTVEESQKLAAQMSSIEYLLVTREGDQIKSSGWDGLVSENFVPKNNAQTLEDTGWGDYELAITLTVGSQNSGGSTPNQYQGRGGRGGGGRRPFVAVWIEDENRDPVRCVSVWFNQSRWIPELRSWYRIYWRKAQSAGQGSLIYSSASATRSSGEYVLEWDGRDDEGNFVDQGNYFILVESAREHGTYQIIRQPIELDGKPKKVELTGNVEISSGSIEYRKKSSR